jgi:hypothetical protein
MAVPAMITTLMNSLAGIDRPPHERARAGRPVAVPVSPVIAAMAERYSAIPMNIS